MLREFAKLTQSKSSSELFTKIYDWGVAIIFSPILIKIASALEPTLLSHIGVFLLTVLDYLTCRLLIFKTGKNKRGEEKKQFFSESLSPLIFKLLSFHLILLVGSIYDYIHLPIVGINFPLTLGFAAIISAKELMSNLENLSAISGTPIINDLRSFVLKKIGVKQEDTKKDKKDGNE